MTIQTRNIHDGAVTSAKLKDDSITNASIGTDAVGAAEIVDGAVDGEHLALTLQTGYIPLDISLVRIISTNDYISTIEGGVPDGNTAPSYQRVNGATDKAARLIWAASSSVEVSFPCFVLPPDIDSSQPLYVKLRANMASGGMDTPTVAVSYFEGVGDTNAGSATAALSTTVATVSVTVTAANVGSAGAPVTIGLTPGAHTNEALNVYAAWVEYTRA